jgi:hypothetical protein
MTTADTFMCVDLSGTVPGGEAGDWTSLSVASSVPACATAVGP